MAKVLNSDWLTAVQFLFLANSVKKSEFSAKMVNSVQFTHRILAFEGGLVRANQILCFGGAKLVDVIIF